MALQYEAIRMTQLCAEHGQQQQKRPSASCRMCLVSRVMHLNRLLHHHDSQKES
jgi:hypothetical protein